MNENKPNGILYYDGSTPPKYIPLSEPVINAFKEKWIKEFGSLNDDHERNGYFFLGFLSSLLNDLNK